MNNKGRPRERRARSPKATALALAIERGEWERVSLYLLLGVAQAARAAPPGAIDDVIALLADEDAGGDR
jgi:hypothetical protein